MFFCKYELSAEIPLRNSFMLFFVLAILLFGAQGGSGEDVELLDRSGNSAVQTTKSPSTEIKYSTAAVTINCF
jgi:hypothetical protein